MSRKKAQETQDVVSRKKLQKTEDVVLRAFNCFVLFVLFCGYVKADDGYRLWLRYDQIESKTIAVEGQSATNWNALEHEL